MSNKVWLPFLYLFGLVIAPCWAYSLTGIEMPKPPEPYDYNTFQPWFKKALNSGPDGGEFKDVKGLRWKALVPKPGQKQCEPENANTLGNTQEKICVADWQDEFDLDSTLGFNNAKWKVVLQQDPNAKKVNDAMKDINKFMFFDDIIIEGDLYAVSNPATHTFVLSQVSENVNFQASPPPVFMDIGCGPGVLVMGWALLGGRAIGTDVDAIQVNSALKHLSNPDRVAQHVKDKCGETSVYVDDVIHMDKPKEPGQPDFLKDMGLGPGSIDAISVGIGMPDMASLEPPAKFLKVGGRMVVPLCFPMEQQKKEVDAKGRCDAEFHVFEKQADGKLVDIPKFSAPGSRIKVQFIKLIDIDDINGKK